MHQTHQKFAPTHIDTSGRHRRFLTTPVRRSSIPPPYMLRHTRAQAREFFTSYIVHRKSYIVHKHRQAPPPLSNHTRPSLLNSATVQASPNPAPHGARTPTNRTSHIVHKHRQAPPPLSNHTRPSLHNSATAPAPPNPAPHGARTPTNRTRLIRGVKIRGTEVE